MHIIRISSTSLEYVKARVSATNAGVPVDMSSLPVAFAFPAPGTDPSTWYSGTWETVDGAYYARCLIGTGGVVALTNGPYDVYVKITATPEVPVKLVGTLIIE